MEKRDHNSEKNGSRPLKPKELVDQKFDSDYLNSLISKAKKSWKGVDADEWLTNLRGGYET